MSKITRLYVATGSSPYPYGTTIIGLDGDNSVGYEIDAEDINYQAAHTTLLTAFLNGLDAEFGFGDPGRHGNQLITEINFPSPPS